MTVAVVILGVVAILSLGVAVYLLTRLLASRNAEHSQDTYLGHQVTELRQGLERVGSAVQELKTAGTSQSLELKGVMSGLSNQMTALNATNSALREALASPRIRGQWGERMAEDVLRLVGFVKDVNYLKQATIEAGEGGGSRPDYTFLLPQGLTLNMDVKFPMDNYMKCIEARDAEEETRYRQQFVRDVRARLKEVVTRNYIDPGRKTLDYVLLFIPNEQIYHYIHEHDSALIEDALASKVVLCSPVSLFAILVVIRQAVDNFRVEQSSNEIISELGKFEDQWGRFIKQMDTLGKRIDDAQRDFGSLAGTRRRALERPLNRIEAIRQERGLSLPANFENIDDTEEPALPEPELAEPREGGS